MQHSKLEAVQLTRRDTDIWLFMVSFQLLVTVTMRTAKCLDWLVTEFRSSSA